MSSNQEIDTRLAKKDALLAIKYLAQASIGKTKIAASCSSVFLLAQAGLLHGRRATTTWWLAHIFRRRYPDVLLDETKMLVFDDLILTAGVALSQMDLMLAIVSDIVGKSVANLCSRYLLIDQRSSQARYMMQNHLLHEDKIVTVAERWIDTHIAQPITVKELSLVLNISTKTLSRHIEIATGVSTIKFIQRRRLSYASHLIETSSLSIEEISSKVGYRDSTALRKLIKREFGLTPSLLR